MHLTCKTVGIAAVVGIVVTVMVGVTVDDVVIGTVGAVVLAYAGEGVDELMAEAQLQPRVEIV
jgi:uncharacterized protein YcfJ